MSETEHFYGGGGGECIATLLEGGIYVSVYKILGIPENGIDDL